MGQDRSGAPGIKAIPLPIHSHGSIFDPCKKIPRQDRKEETQVISAKEKCIPVEQRIYADIDNERPYDLDIVGLTQNDEVLNYFREVILIQEGDYVYLYMDYADGDHVFCEGIVIKNPYPTMPYKWCCTILGQIEYMSEYNKRFGRI